MDSETKSQITAEIAQLQNLRSQLRSQERVINRQEQSLRYEPAIGDGSPMNIRDNLASFLPTHMMPGNVGGYNTVFWPYHFQVPFDFNTQKVAGTLTINPYTTMLSSVQVPQEAAFVLMSISRTSHTETASGSGGPWTFQVRDRQSSRTLNDRPMPFQMIGSKSLPTVLPTGMIFFPNAFIEITMGTWLTGTQVMTTQDDAYNEFVLFGYRVRIEDVEKVLSSVFSGERN